MSHHDDVPSAAALQRAIDRLGLGAVANPGRKSRARTRGRPERAPGELPRGISVYEMAQGTDLWRGTSDPDDWRDGWQWFTDGAYTARGYMEGRCGEWCVLWFETTRPMRLVSLANYDALDALAESLGVEGYDGDPRNAAAAVCELGLDGWYIAEGDHDGTDVLLCDPASLRFIRGVDQSDGWDWSAWPAYA